jgi:ribonucleoside-diphosphate reductase beta chain
MQLVKERLTYRPFDRDLYFLFDAFKDQLNMFWLPGEVNMTDDIKEFNTELTDKERNLLTLILKFFTQGDLRVAEAYLTEYVPAFPIPEARMCFSTFACMEAIHVQSYAYLNDSFNLPEKDFSAFLEYSEMVSKLDILDNASNEENVLLKLAVFSAFMEGMCLFSSFAILLSFARLGVMSGLGQIISLSIRDETLHVNTMVKLYNVLVSKLTAEKRYEIEKKIPEYCIKLVDAEDRFIDLCYENGEARGLKDKEELKGFIREVANRRLKMLGLPPLYEVSSVNLPWFDDMVSSPEHGNFFETKVTSYAKVDLDWGNAYG